MLALTNVKILTMEDKDYLTGTVLLKNGKIAAVGENIAIPDGYQEIDLTAKTLLPGMIDAHTHVGIGEEGLGWEGRDYNEMSDPITPHLRAIDAVNPADEAFKEARENGVTALMTGPGSANVIGGENLVLKTKSANLIEKMILKDPAGIKAAFGENPKKVYSDQKKSPMTRMAVAAAMREALIKAEDYLSEKEKKRTSGELFKRDIKMESLGRILNKEIPLKIHAHRADDIATALRIAKEFAIDITIEHCTEGHLLAEELRESNIAAVVGPSMTGRVKVELKELSFRTACVLNEAGVLVALMSDHPVVPVYNLPVYAALAVKAGMERKEALKAITINPAKILQVDNRVGSIKVGKDADLVVFSGDPLLLESKVEMVFIDGERV